MSSPGCFLTCRVSDLSLVHLCPPLLRIPDRLILQSSSSGSVIFFSCAGSLSLADCFGWQSFFTFVFLFLLFPGHGDVYLLLKRFLLFSSLSCLALHRRGEVWGAGPGDCLCAPLGLLAARPQTSPL